MPRPHHLHPRLALPWHSRHARVWTRRLAAARRILLASDFDGTLSEIVTVPAAAVAVVGAEAVLQRLAGNPRWAVALVSGRGAADLQQRCRLGPVWYLGSHGNETLAPAGTILAGPVRMPAELRGRVQAALEAWPGTHLEAKPRSLALHFRQAPAAAANVEQLARDLALAYRLRVLPGKCVFELQAAEDGDKGQALTALRRRLHCDLTVFLGDDQTDENVFQRRDARLLGVHVGPPEHTAAEFWVPDPPSAVRWLRHVARSVAAFRTA